MKEINIFDCIIEKYGSLTKSELKIADYLLNSKPGAPKATITELAAACSVSEATVTRFCRNIADIGYNEFRKALQNSQMPVLENAQDFPDLYGQVDSSDSIETKSRKLWHIASLALQKTRDLIDPAAVSAAVDLLFNARNVFCLGQGNSSIVAYDTCGRFCSVTTKFHWLSDSHLQASYESIADEGDVFLYFSFSAATRELQEAAEILKQTPAKLILVTRFPNMPAAQNADIVLLCGADESPRQQGSIAAKISQLYLVDLLFNEYCARDPEGSRRLREKTLEAAAGKLLKD